MEETKLCSTCKKVKSVKEFWKRTKSKDGLSYKCKQCTAELTNKWKSENRDKQRAYEIEYKKKNKEKVRQNGREWVAQKRRREGIPARGPWMKYREKRLGITLDVEPIANFLSEYLKRNHKSIGDLSNYSTLSEKRIRNIINKTEPKITQSTIDKLLIAINEQDKWHELYPVSLD